MPALPAITAPYDTTGQFDDANLLPWLPFTNDPAATLIGSAPKEFAMGHAAAAATWASWKALKLVQTAKRRLSDSYDMGSTAATFEHITIAFKRGGKSVVVPYRVLVITHGGSPADPEPTLIVSAHFSIAKLAAAAASPTSRSKVAR